MNINDGNRPSRLEQGRVLVGERPGDGVAMDPAYVAAVASARPPAFDFAALTARAAALPADDPVMHAPDEGETSDPAPSPRPDPARHVDPAPARRAQRGPGSAVRRWAGRVGLLAAALTLLYVVRQPPQDRLKGGDSDLAFFVEHGGNVFPGDPASPVSAGDGIQFSYRTSASRLVLLSVDAEGTVSVFWPAPNRLPPDGRGVQVIPGDRRLLDGSVVLDDAPSPEVFVGFFGDWTVDAARERARGAFAAGGIEAVMDLGDAESNASRAGEPDDGDIAVVTLEKVD